MANTEIRNVTIVGTGLIGASWAAQYLARGFDVIATDPAPNAESNLRKCVDEAWDLLTVIGLAPGASRDRLSFTADMKEAVSKADFVQESVPERAVLKARVFAQMDEVAPLDTILASSASAITMDTIQSGCKHSERCVIGHPFNPPHVIPLVEVVGRKDVRGGNRTNHDVLCIDRQEADPVAQGDLRPRRKPPASSALPRDSLSPSAGRRQCRGRRHCCVLWAGPPMGRDGPQPTVAFGRRARRNPPLF
jgi:hypothetical protein